MNHLTTIHRKDLANHRPQENLNEEFALGLVPMSSSPKSLEQYIVQKRTGRDKGLRFSMPHSSTSYHEFSATLSNRAYNDDTIFALPHELSQRKHLSQDLHHPRNQQPAPDKFNAARASHCYNSEDFHDRLSSNMNYSHDNDGLHQIGTQSNTSVRNPIQDCVPVATGVSRISETAANPSSRYVPDQYHKSLFDYPQIPIRAHGTFRYARHTSGDLSVFQWSSESVSWAYIGVIPADKVSHFVTLVERIQKDQQYKDEQGQQLLHAHIAAMVRQFSSPAYATLKKLAQTPIGDDCRSMSPVCRHIVAYLRQQIVLGESDSDCDSSLSEQTMGLRLHEEGKDSLSAKRTRTSPKHEGQNEHLLLKADAHDQRSNLMRGAEHTSCEVAIQCPPRLASSFSRQGEVEPARTKIAGGQQSTWTSLENSNSSMHYSSKTPCSDMSQSHDSPISSNEKREMRRTVLFDPYRSSNPETEAKLSLSSFGSGQLRIERDVFVNRLIGWDVNKPIKAGILKGNLKQYGFRTLEEIRAEREASNQEYMLKLSHRMNLSMLHSEYLEHLPCVSTGIKHLEMQECSTPVNQHRTIIRPHRDIGKHIEELETLFASGRNQFDALQPGLSELLEDWNLLDNKVAETTTRLLIPSLENLLDYASDKVMPGNFKPSPRNLGVE